MNTITLDSVDTVALAEMRQTLAATSGVKDKLVIMAKIVALMEAGLVDKSGKAVIDGIEIDIYAENFGLAPWPKTLQDNDPLLTPTEKLEFATKVDGTRVPRTQLHGEIVSRFFKDVQKPNGRKPIAYVMGGGGASGKGTIKKILIQQGLMPSHGPVELDPDEIKDSIPEYRKIIDAGDSRAAGVVHEESSMIAKRVLSGAIEGGYDLTYDVTLGDETKGIAVLRRLKDAGYEVHLVGVVIDPAVALFRADKRARRSGRYVPVKDLLKAHKGFLAAFERYAAIADTAVLYDNSGAKEEKLVSVTQADGTEVLSSAGFDSAKQRNEVINENASNLSEASPRSESVAKAVHPGASPAGDEGTQGSGGSQQQEGPQLSGATGLFGKKLSPEVNTDPASINEFSDADEAVASGAQPRTQTRHFYEFDPNRKHSQRKRDNAAAMALLDQIDAGEVNPKKLTPAQKQALAKYSGTGGALIGADGKKGSAYEYYTPTPIAEGMWGLLTELGFAGGRVLDPCAATGVFGATAPMNAAIDAVELNETSGRINGLINDGPGYNAIVSPFEAVAAATPDEGFDAIATNVPFAKEVSARGASRFKDTKYRDEPIENYFILRSIEKLRPGGLAMFITPPRCVSGKGGKQADLRYRVSLMAEFMGAYRLPNKVFGTADADTMSDVVIFRKFSRPMLDKISELSEQNPKVLTEANVLWPEFLGGKYFEGEGLRRIIGTMAKGKGQWGEVDILHSDLSMPEIAKLMRKFGPSRINWDALDGTETEPIVYKEGDTVHHAGQTLQMKGGQLVALDSVGNMGGEDFSSTINELSSPLAAVQNKVAWGDALHAFEWMIRTNQALNVPGWLRETVYGLKRLGESSRAANWNAATAGMAVIEVMTQHQAEEVGFDYLTEYPDLSERVQRVAMDAKKSPTALNSAARDGMARIGVIYNKKTGFSAVWRGDVVTNQADTRTADQRIEAVKYVNGSPYMGLADIKAVYGENFDPMASADWCVLSDGKGFSKASDYYVGNYANFLRKIDAQIASEKDPAVKDKLVAQKLEADKMVDRVDPTAMSFNLFSPFVTLEEKADFMRRFVDARYEIEYNDKGEAAIGITIKGSQPTEREKLLKRVALYLEHGSHTLGSAQFSDQGAALEALRTMTATYNAQFSSWVKSNPAIMARLSKTANNPESLYFRQIDDEAPLDIPGLNPDFKMNGYKFDYIRKMGREFSGINGYGVGLGKTSTALAVVQHAQNIGVKKKTLFVVPNSVLTNWRKEASMVLADTSDCLYVGLNLNKNGTGKVASKDYDRDLMAILENRHKKIFMTAEAFSRLRLREETATAYDAYLASVDVSYAESDDKKKDEKSAGRRAELIHGLTNDRAKSAAAPFFEDLGIDSIVIDEAHQYKNAANVNDFKGGKFLSMAGASGRGMDAQAKTWFVRKTSGVRGDGVICLTATPVTNSPLEIYSMLSLAVGHQRLNDMMMGIKGADSFMQTMCKIESHDEEAIDGERKAFEVFTGLSNVNVLRNAINQVCTIKTAEDVGGHIQLPEADEVATSIQLPSDVVDLLIDYKNAYRFAADTIKEKDVIGGDAAAYERVAAKFGEEMELIGHPFNLINKMTSLIQDRELDDRGTFYTFGEQDRKKAEKVVADYNAKAPIEERPREGPQTRPDAVVGVKKKRDGDSEVTLLQIKALARIEGARIVVDTIDPANQEKFEAFADKAGLDLDVSIPPKVAAMLENFKKEEANPRGVDGEGNPSPRVKQIIFCDTLALHNKIKRLLTKRCGVSASAIAIITGRVNGKPEQIIDVQEGFNADGDDNKYRVILANEKAEVGINLQKGTQAIHHLTVGWTPDSLTQRNGRGVRQGNKTARVSVYHYDADGTFDNYKRKLVSKKSDWIDAVMDKSGGSDVEIQGGLTNEQLEELMSSMGDAGAVGRIQERADAADKAARAATTQTRQLVNLQTAAAQKTFMTKYAKPAAWAADKLAAYIVATEQIGVLKSRLTNPKITQNSHVKTNNLLSEFTARAAGLKKLLEEALVVKEKGYSDKEPKGDALSLEQIVSKSRGYGLKRGERADERAREWLSGNHYGYDVQITVGSSIENEWQSEVDMAASMVSESRKDFEVLAGREGAFGTDVLAKFEAGEAAVTDGKILCSGAFIQMKGSAMAVITRENGVFFARVLDPVNKKAYRVAAVDAIRGATVVLPGAPGYDEMIDKAADLEDKTIALLGAAIDPEKMAGLFSAAVPQVAQRRKAQFDVSYPINAWALPHPYFPHVFTPDDAQKGGNVVKAIFAKQEGIIKGYKTDYPVSFTVDSTVSPIDAPGTDHKQLISYAKAHGLKFNDRDLDVTRIYRISYLADLEASDFQADVIDASANADELNANLEKWFRAVLPIYDLDSDIRFAGGAIGLLPVFTSQRIAFNTRMAAFNAGKTPEQAQASADVDPNRMVGINGDTRTWKDQIKSCASMAGGRAVWDGTAECWNIPLKGWEKLVAMYPAAAKALSVVEASGKTSYKGYRRR